MPRRFDLAEMQEPKIDQNGYLHADARPTRAGVFIYHHPDGSVTREFRSPEEVFKAESMETLANRPVTDGHPAEGQLNPGNTKRLAVGALIADPGREDEFIKTRLMITDQVAIDKCTREDSPVRELSCGYQCDTIPKEGLYQGIPYDHIQKNIVYNHVALVDKGRAGPGARLVLDAADGAVEGVDMELKKDQPEPKEQGTMLKIKKDAVATATFRVDALNIEVDNDSEKAVNLILGKLDGAVDHIRGLEADLEKVKADSQAEIDRLTGELDQAKKDSVISPDKLNTMVAERADVIGVAVHVGVKNDNLDSLDTAEIKKLIVATKNDGISLDEKGADYIQGCYDHIVAGIKADNEGLKSLAALKAATTDNGEAVHVDESEESDLSPREKFMNDSADMWKGEEASA